MSQRARAGGRRRGADFSDEGGGTSIGKKFWRSEGPITVSRAWGTRKRDLGDREEIFFLGDLEGNENCFSPQKIDPDILGDKERSSRILRGMRYSILLHCNSIHRLLLQCGCCQSLFMYTHSKLQAPRVHPALPTAALCTAKENYLKGALHDPLGKSNLLPEFPDERETTNRVLWWTSTERRSLQSLNRFLSSTSR